MSTKRTYQPKKRKRKKSCGFLNRNKKVIQKRRQKGRKKLTTA